MSGCQYDVIMTSMWGHNDVIILLIGWNCILENMTCDGELMSLPTSLNGCETVCRRMSNTCAAYRFHNQQCTLKTSQCKNSIKKTEGGKLYIINPGENLPPNFIYSTIFLSKMYRNTIFFFGFHISIQLSNSTDDYATVFFRCHGASIGIIVAKNYEDIL